ncbi:MAG: type II/IV secretion system protein [Phycisphaerae bacterium]|nr:type II/IV secretion system protein [Phycisphaerae bacterium]
MTPAIRDPRSAPGFTYDAGAFRTHVLGTGELTEANWRLASEVSRQSGTSELRSLLDLGLLGEETLADRLAAWSGARRWRAATEQGTLSDGVPREFMKSNTILAFNDGDGERVRVVIADPSDSFLWSAVSARFGPSPEVMIGSQKEINLFLDEQAAPAGPAGKDAEEALDVTSELSALRDMASEAPVVRFFNQAVERAMDLGASDIHLERFDRRVSLRFRVDGILLDQPPPPAPLYEAILCRIKIMANLDIAERRRAQDGRVPMRLRGRMVDMRISIVPTMYGQDAAIRLQDRQKLAEIELDQLGFSPEHIDRLVRTANKNHGILLITGPTGSGKTTSLYALLRRIKTDELKIVTVEDPVEYAMDGVNQIQVNNAINLTFGNTLRHVLRHDPDVILIGEIRDKETAEIAFQASLTGHMVLSTLHTNDVPGTFVRLIDMGIEPYLVNAALEGVAAQRLIRKVCRECLNREPAREGCKGCGGIGYRGRVAVMEYSGVTPEVKRLMLQGGEEHRIREALLRSGYLPMRAEAQRLIEEGVTDEAEVVRALGAAAAVEA